MDKKKGKGKNRVFVRLKIRLVLYDNINMFFFESIKEKFINYVWYVWFIWFFELDWFLILVSSIGWIWFVGYCNNDR